MKIFQQRLLLGLLHLLFAASNFTLPSMAGWELQWIDRFDGNGIDWNNWTAQIQANFNAEVQCYTDDDSSNNKNYDVSNGTLKIIARKQFINCPGLSQSPREWTSGRINSKDKREFLYGRIEARIRFLNLEAGTWPAFWMLENRIFEDPIANDNDFITWPNPGAGEIDVWEWFSNNPGSYITNFFNTNGCGSEVRYTYPNGPGQVQQWHDYAIEWDANTIKFYIDDFMVTSHDVSACPQYKEPMFVLLNVAMGGNLGGAIDPSLTLATMEVDYVAHCNPTHSNSATRCNESTPTPGNRAPEITSDAIRTVDANEAYSYTMTATDADGDTLTFSASVLPDWLSFDTARGVLSGNPAIENIGNHSVTLTASDSVDAVSQTFSIVVSAENRPPSILSPDSDKATVGTFYRFTLIADDADNDSLLLSVSLKPDWLSFNTNTGVLSGTPPSDSAGSSQIVFFLVSDGRDSISQKLTINVIDSKGSDTSGNSSGGGSTDLLFLVILGIIIVGRKIYGESIYPSRSNNFVDRN